MSTAVEREIQHLMTGLIALEAAERYITWKSPEKRAFRVVLNYITMLIVRQRGAQSKIMPNFVTSNGDYDHAYPLSLS